MHIPDGFKRACTKQKSGPINATIITLQNAVRVAYTPDDFLIWNKKPMTEEQRKAMWAGGRGGGGGRGGFSPSGQYHGPGIKAGKPVHSPTLGSGRPGINKPQPNPNPDPWAGYNQSGRIQDGSTVPDYVKPGVTPYLPPLKENQLKTTPNTGSVNKKPGGGKVGGGGGGGRGGGGGSNPLKPNIPKPQVPMPQIPMPALPGRGNTPIRPTPMPMPTQGNPYDPGRSPTDPSLSGGPYNPGGPYASPPPYSGGPAPMPGIPGVVRQQPSQQPYQGGPAPVGPYPGPGYTVRPPQQVDTVGGGRGGGGRSGGGGNPPEGSRLRDPLTGRQFIAGQNMTMDLGTTEAYRRAVDAYGSGPARDQGGYSSGPVGNAPILPGPGNGAGRTGGGGGGGGGGSVSIGGGVGNGRPTSDYGDGTRGSDIIESRVATPDELRGAPPAPAGQYYRYEERADGTKTFVLEPIGNQVQLINRPNEIGKLVDPKEYFNQPDTQQVTLNDEPAKAGEQQPLGDSGSGKQAPIDPKAGPPARGEFPREWGKPPLKQTRDMVDLPTGGKGSTTLKNWIESKIEEFGMPGEESQEPVRQIVESGFQSTPDDNGIRVLTGDEWAKMNEGTGGFKPDRNAIGEYNGEKGIWYNDTTFVPDDKSSTTTPAENTKQNQRLKEYPEEWGEPPSRQTRDMVDLPTGGKGSTTLKNWIQSKIDEFGMPGEDGAVSPPSDTMDVAPPPEGLKEYPEEWGEPPSRQMRDVVDLPTGGKGSTTLKNWIQSKLEEFGMPDIDPDGRASYGSVGDNSLDSSATETPYVDPRGLPMSAPDENGVMIGSLNDLNRYMIDVRGTGGMKGQLQFYNGQRGLWMGNNFYAMSASSSSSEPIRPKTKTEKTRDTLRRLRA